MTQDEETVVRLAARGDGVTATGRHAPGAAPGDRIGADGTILPGPHRQTPPCRHFGRCGGCQLQHVDDAALADFVRDRVVNAALAQGLHPEEVSAPAMSPPRSRRRATLRAINGGGRAVVGFNEAGSHKVFDLVECHVLDGRLFTLVAPLRRYFSSLRGKFTIGIEVALTDQGPDLLLTGHAPQGLEATEGLLELARAAGLARLAIDGGYGAEMFWEPQPVTVSFGKVAVPMPPGAFLQATPEGEAALVGAALEWLDGAGRVADLFAGLGTFALPLAAAGKRVLAAEGDRAATLALKSGAGAARLGVECAHRDLFRNPLRVEELRGFDAVVLDPPRAGARAQVEQIAASGVARVVYVSCNPSSWARDAAVLAASGYRLAAVRPVGQFRWSTHVELASLFLKRGEDAL